MKIKKFLVCALALGVLAITSTFSITSAHKVVADGWSTFDPDTYEYGENASLPPMTYVENGQTYNATIVVTFPSGKEQMGEDIEFSEPGLYVITYTVNVDGVIHSRQEQIFINYQQLSIGNNKKSSLEYIDDAHKSRINSSRPGMLVNLAFGDSLTFTKPIDVKDLTSENILFQGFVVPSTEGSCDFSQLIIKLENLEDPNNFLKIKYISHVEVNSDGSTSHSSSVLACSDVATSFRGVHQSQGLIIDGKYGTWSGCTFDGYVQPSYKSTYYDTCLMNAGFDAATANVYGCGFGLGKILDRVIDLDNPAEVAKSWGGFTGDKVKMSISCDAYSGSTASFVISSIFGVNAADLAQNIFVDEEEPVITLKDDYSVMPDSAVGCTYPISEAVAFDTISGNCKVDTKVYFNYFDAANRTSVEIIDGNQFITDRTGLYTIVYSAKDYAGNIAEVKKTIKVFTTVDKPDFDLPTHANSLPIGSFVNVDRDLAIKSANGDCIVNVYYQEDGGEKTLITDNGFRLLKLTNYTVTYEVIDFIGQITEKSYVVSATNSSLPILEKEYTLPRYLISGGYYKVDAMNAYVQDGTVAKAVLCDLVVTIDANAKTYKVGEEYNPIVSATDSYVNLAIVYQGNVLQQENVLAIKSLGTATKPSALNLYNYFVSPDLSRTDYPFEMDLRPNTTKYPGDEVKGMEFDNLGSQDNFTFDFANYLLGCNFSMTLSSVMNMKEDSEITLTLTDALDKDIKVSMSLYFDGTNTYLKHGDKKVLVVGSPFNRLTSNFVVSFSQNIFSCNGYSLAAYVQDDGSLFTGFTSFKVYASITAKKLNTNSYFVLNDLCGYGFSSTSARDRGTPSIYLSKDIGGSREINSYYHIDPIYSADVLSPNIIFTMSITYSNGEYAKDENGNPYKDLDPTKGYDIYLDKYDTYTVNIVSQEDPRFLASPNRYEMPKVIHVYDSIKPVIEMKETFQSEVKQNTIVRFPNFEYSDNITAKDKLVVQRVYLDPSGLYHNMTSSETQIAFTILGQYKIMINVMDEAGNIANVTMYVNVIK